MRWNQWRRAQPVALTTELAHALDELARARRVAFGGFGIAGVILPATKAFRTVLASGAEVRGSVERLFQDATPAGRVYAAVLLTAMDPKAGRVAWQQLSTQTGTVEVANGCAITEGPIATLAANELRRPSLTVGFRPR